LIRDSIMKKPSRKDTDIKKNLVQFASFEPIAPNDSATGRARNQRVCLILTRKD